CHETFGWTIDEINAQDDALALFYPDPAVREEVARAITIDPSGRFREWHPVTKDGKTLTTMWANFRFTDGTVFNLGHDITERKRADEERERLLHDRGERVKELRCSYGVVESIRSRETIEQVFEDVVALIQQGWQYPEITRSRIRFDDQEFDSQPFEETEWQQSADIVLAGEARGTVEVFYLEERSELDEGPFLKEERNLLEGIARALSEALEREHAQKELGRLATAIDQAAETVVITDAEGRIQYVNPAFERITGYSRMEAIGQNPRILQSGKHDDIFYRKMWDTLTRGETWSGRFINRKKDETFYTEEVTISPVHDSSGETVNYVAVKRDITEEIRLENQLQQAQKMEAVGQLAGGVAHDFNNLLQVINGYTEMALRDIACSHPAHGSIKEVARAGDRARTLVNQLLSFSRRQIINPVDLDLNEVIFNLMKMIRRVIGEHIKCDFIPGRGLGTVHADRGQMEQVLMNLCVNSRDAMPNGGSITIETGNVLINGDYIRMHQWARPGRFVLLSITDTGFGMDDETLNSVFDPFFTTKEVGKGTGLGLSTVYGIVKQHDGDIQVYSEIGKGTIFKVYLSAVEHRAAEISSSVPGPAVGGTETILVAEDDDMVRNLTVQTLERAGYTVLNAGNGEEAVRLFEAHADEIALAVLDVVMPGLGGRQVHDRIKEIHPHTRVLFSSGYSHNAIHTSFILDEGLQLIQKPYGPDALIRRVREVLDS
ncbi:MAG: PAS domain S-box protein, partial [Candidatus Fermentibacteraceae bacterium]|nr:PAS domain S-box protein [Candidatus Fermentibacteraceae bacterium]